MHSVCHWYVSPLPTMMVPFISATTPPTILSHHVSTEAALPTCHCCCFHTTIITLITYITLITPNYLYYLNYPNYLYYLNYPNYLYYLNYPNYICCLDYPNYLYIALITLITYVLVLTVAPPPPPPLPAAGDRMLFRPQYVYHLLVSRDLPRQHEPQHGRQPGSHRCADWGGGWQGWGCRQLPK